MNANKFLNEIKEIKMTSIYCPKGHKNELFRESYEDILGEEWSMVICNHLACSRPYFEMDCLSQEQFKSSESKKNEIETQNNVHVINDSKCEHDLEEIIFTYERPGGVPGFQKGFKCKKCGFIPKGEERIRYSTLYPNAYISNFKTESKISVDRVIEAFREIAKTLLDTIHQINKQLEELNK